jgi:hypothetical protein
MASAVDGRPGLTSVTPVLTGATPVLMAVLTAA